MYILRHHIIQLAGKAIYLAAWHMFIMFEEFIYHSIILMYVINISVKANGGVQRQGSAPIRQRWPRWSAYHWRWRSPACRRSVPSPALAPAAPRTLAANLETPPTTPLKKKGSEWHAHVADPLAPSSRARETAMMPTGARWRSQWQCCVRKPWAS